MCYIRTNYYYYYYYQIYSFFQTKFEFENSYLVIQFSVFQLILRSTRKQGSVLTEPSSSSSTLGMNNAVRIIVTSRRTSRGYSTSSIRRGNGNNTASSSRWYIFTPSFQKFLLWQAWKCCINPDGIDLFTQVIITIIMIMMVIMKMIIIKGIRRRKQNCIGLSYYHYSQPVYSDRPMETHNNWWL